PPRLLLALSPSARFALPVPPPVPPSSPTRRSSRLYGLSMTQLGMIGLGFSITYGVGKTLVSYYADGKNTKQFLPFMLILSAICIDRKSTRLNSSHVSTSYAVFCFQKRKSASSCNWH